MLFQEEDVYVDQLGLCEYCARSWAFVPDHGRQIRKCELSPQSNRPRLQALPRRSPFCYDSPRSGRAGASMTRPLCLALSMLLTSGSVVASTPPAAEPTQPKSPPIIVIGFV